jgi:hypothetical protein
MKPPQENTARTKTANASPVWSVGFGFGGNGKNTWKMSAAATAAAMPPPKNPMTSRSNGWFTFTVRVDEA